MRAAATRSFVVLAFAALPAFAEEEARLLSPDEFLSRVEGKTVHYTVDGQHYGTERFYGKGRATWQFPADTCEDGLYQSLKEEICFRYETTSCWSVFEDAENQMSATSRDGFRVVIEQIDDTPLRCDGNPIS